MGKEKEYKFTGKVVRCIYDTESFRIYAFDVDKKKYPNIKHSKYKDVSVMGELPVLSLNTEYTITATPKESQYGTSYKVINIKREKPTTANEVYIFLSEFLTENQTSVLMKHYPDIIDRVRENRLDDIDLNKLKGIKEYTFNVVKNKIVENFCLLDLVVEFNGYLSLSIIRKIYNKYSSIEILKQKLKTDPYKCLCGLAGVGFKTADSVLLNIEKASKENIENGKEPIVEFDCDLRTSPQRCLACILYLLSENENEGNTKMNLADLRSQCLKTTPACADHFVEVIKSDKIYYSKETMDVALKDTYKTEKYIADTILNNVDNKNNVWNFDTSKYRALNGFQLSDEQMCILDTVCKNQINILNGSAGCVDCDTEYFNGTEWKRIADYQDGEKVLQYNKDGSAELVYPMNYIKRHSEYLWHFETKYGLDQCLSDNHTCYYITSKNNLYSKSFKEVRLNQEQSGFKGKFITTFDYSGNGINLSDNDIRLMIATFADGSFYSQNCSDDCYTQARFHIKKQRKKDRLIDLFKITNRTYKEKPSATEGYTDFYVNVPFRCKHFPKEWYNCSRHQMEIIADEVLYWDSSYKEHNRFSTTNKNDADFIQFVFTSLGYRTTIAINDRTNREYFTNNKIYVRKSKEYIVSYTTRNLISMCCDTRCNHNKTKIVPYKTIDGYEYCFTVPSHILVLRRNNKIFITGNCGKSSSVQAIINMLIDNQKTFKIFAPTGKAAKVISAFTKQKASTIHRGLEYSPAKVKEIEYIDENGKQQTEYTCWGYNRANKLQCDIVIIDEFSMVDLNLFKKVIDAIDFTKTKLLMIGDNAQLPSVGCGNLLHDFMKSKIIPTVTLTKVFRYSEGGLMKVATDVRCSKTYLDNTMKSKATVFGNNQDYVFIDLDSEAIPKNAVALYKKLLDKGNTIENIQVLTAKNVSECGTNVLNNMLQRIANPNFNSATNIKVGDTTYYIGDLIIQKQNNYKAKLDCNHLLNNMETVDSKQIEFDLETQLLSDNIKDSESPTVFVANGETGIIKDIYDMIVVIDFDGIYVKYNKEDMNMVGLGYAITIHKCLTSDTYIYTNKGIKQLLDLIKICQFNENGVALLPDDLLIYNGKKLEKPKCLISNGVQPCKQIITTKGSCITGTYNHGLDVINSEGYIERKNISEIKDTDYLVVCKNQNIFGANTSIPRKWHPMQQNARAKIYNLPKTITEDFAEFLGYMVADGTIYKKGNGIRYGKNQKEVVERFQHLTQKIFNYNNATGIKHIDGKLGGMYYYEINSVYINSFLSKIDGIQPNDKFVPNCIMESPQNIQIKFLKGLFEDGTVNVKIHEDKKHFDHIELSLKDGNIIKQIRMMLLNLGICSTITSRIRTKDNNMYSQNVIYIYKQDAKIFNRLIGFTSNDKKENLDLCNETILNSRSIIPNIYKIIVKIKEKYNLRLKDCNNELHTFAFRKNAKGLTTRLLKCFLDYYKTILSDDTDYQYLEFLYYNCNIEKVDKIIDNIVKPTYCVEMPDSHKFIQNGFYGWNSQGSSIDNVILCTPQSHIFMLNNNLLYTGLTRMRKKCYHLGTLKSVNQAIGKKANLERNTFMQELLKTNV